MNFATVQLFLVTFVAWSHFPGLFSSGGHCGLPVLLHALVELQRQRQRERLGVWYLLSSISAFLLSSSSLALWPLHALLAQTFASTLMFFFFVVAGVLRAVGLSSAQVIRAYIYEATAIIMAAILLVNATTYQLASLSPCFVKFVLVLC
jgi:hypothetical protein